MTFLIDTNVISAVRRPDRAPRVVSWLTAQAEQDLYLSVLTVGEIERGIRLQETKNADFARDLAAWLDETVRIFADRLMAFSAEDARRWGVLSARVGHTGVDLMIAAQALNRDAVVVTRNVADFAATGARIFDPF